MRRISRCARGATCFISLAAAISTAFAADIGNGWSSTTAISNIYSVGSGTMFKLAGTTLGCGHGDFWVLPLNDTTASKTKHALLISAFTSGKQVSLRCENSAVTDFQVSN